MWRYEDMRCLPLEIATSGVVESVDLISADINAHRVHNGKLCSLPVIQMFIAMI